MIDIHAYIRTVQRAVEQEGIPVIAHFMGRFGRAPLEIAYEELEEGFSRKNYDIM